MASEIKPKIDPEERVIFSAPELLAVRSAMQELVTSNQDEGAQVWFQGGLVEGHIQCELRFANMKRSRVLTMEAACVVNLKDAKDIVEVRAGIVEFLGAMFEEWLQEEGIRSPSLDWKDHSYSQRDYMFRGALTNEEAESEADAFLRKHGLDPEKLWDDDGEDYVFEGEDDADEPEQP